MKKKRALAQASAGAVAVATVLAGVAIGPAAARAASAGPQAFISYAGGTSGHVMQAFKANAVVETSTFAEGTLTQVPQPGRTGQIRQGDLCLTGTDIKGGRVLATKCSDAESQLWAVGQNDGNLYYRGKGANYDYGINIIGAQTAELFLTAGQAMRVRSEGSVGWFHASTADKDTLSRSATISGGGMPGSWVSVGDGSQVQVAADGTWAAKVSNLKLGNNKIALEHYTGKDLTANTSVTVTLNAPQAILAWKADPLNHNLQEFTAGANAWTVKGKTGTVTQVPQPGYPGQVRQGDLCLTGTDAPKNTWITATDCSGGENQQWNTTSEGRLLYAGPGVNKGYGIGINGSDSRAELLLLKEGWMQVVADSSTNLFAQDSHDDDLASRSATFKGRGVPGASITLNGGNTVKVARDGTWSATITGLKLGTNAVSIEQLEDHGIRTAKADSTVSFDPTEIKAEAAFPTDIAKDLTISGSAHAGAKVEIYNAAGKLVKTVSADAATGKFSAGIAAPNAGGKQTYTIKQVLQGETAAKTLTVTADYGNAVKITSPENNVEHGGGQLVFRGTGEPGSTVDLRKQGSQNIVASGTVSNSGTWSVTVANIPAADAAYSVTQSSKGANTTTSNVTLLLTATGIKAEAAFPTDIAKDLTISGSAHAGAKVEIYNAAGKLVKTVSADAATGKFSAGIAAPNAGGKQTYTIKQVLHGETAAGTVTVTADYGNAVKITSPENNVEHGGGQLEFRGTGEPGSTVDLRKQGSQDIVASGTVSKSGTWSFAAANIPAADAVYSVTQSSKGANTTTSNVTLISTVQYQPITVTAPESGSQFAPNTSVLFTGKGTPGGTVTLTPTNGAAAVSTTVDDDGDWSINRFLGNGPYTFDVKQVAAGQTSQVNGIALTPKSAAPIDQPFTVTSPATGSSAASKAVAFTGTGAAGTTVRIHTTNFTSADITTVVKNDGTWSVNKWIGNGPYVIDITQEGRVTGELRGLEINPVIGIDKPFAVISPTAGDDIRSKVQTFTGTGRHGETVTLKAISPAGLAEVSGIVNTDGTWSINRYIGDGPYAFDIIQTKDGVESGAERDFRINQPAKDDSTSEGKDQPLAVTAPADGDTFTANTQVAFTGTGKVGATITVAPASGSAVTTTVTRDGTWSVKKFLGNGPYTFTVTSTLDDATETVPGSISLTPAK
ncbi:Ig-like domain-containing protein [Curtobacterium flaccumfaciens]|uniref:Ig-like domain-containing protein n=1 Tax=Curtobacterium flaccumfaciens TaxID=2035 RepID=UPI0021C6C5E9|nr:Ig-like domain-containing protein [Curtobacterium flaccumfaciens]UXN20907.1 Ig-like domain-containing protein [Curtobacterium flaccumfaciens pv. flaccumfaciens]